MKITLKHSQRALEGIQNIQSDSEHESRGCFDAQKFLGMLLLHTLFLHIYVRTYSFLWPKLYVRTAYTSKKLLTFVFLVEEFCIISVPPHNFGSHKQKVISQNYVLYILQKETMNSY